MGRPKGSKNKNEFDALPDSLVSELRMADEAKLKGKLAEVTLLAEEQRETMEADADLQSAKMTLKDLMSPYKEDMKINKQTIKLCKSILDSRGRAPTA